MADFPSLSGYNIPADHLCYFRNRYSGIAPGKTASNRVAFTTGITNGLSQKSAFKKRLILFFASSVFTFWSCTLPSADFSEYIDTNLIPEATLDQWNTDQDSDASSPYMRYERIDDASTGTFLATTGFADSDSLYATMPVSVTDEVGAEPPVYRLEVKNLLINGDFEDTGFVPAVSGGAGTTTDLDPGYGWYMYQDMAAATPTVDIDVALSGEMGGAGNRFMRINLGSKDNYVFADFSGALAGSSFVGADYGSYNIGFDFIVDRQEFSIGWGDVSETDDRLFLNVRYQDSGDINSEAVFPEDTVYQVSSISTLPGESLLSINPRSGESAQQILNIQIDNFTIVDTQKSYALFYNVPYRLLDGDGNESRPRLRSGGLYTFRVLIRADPTASNLSGTLNRYKAEKLSISLHDDVERTIGYVPGTVFTASADWDDWTEITVSAQNLIAFQDIYDSPANDTAFIQINIVPMDTTNAGTQFPGSILFSAPRLYWSPDAE